MNYQEFKNHVLQEIPKYLPEGKRNVAVVKYYKVNTYYEGLVLRTDGIHPNIPIEAYYRDHVAGIEMEKILKDLAEHLLIEPDQHLKDVVLNSRVGHMTNLDEKLSLQVINAKKNEEFLKTVPHRKVLDLAIIYRYIVKADSSGIASITIKNEMLNLLDKTEQELYEIAYENSKNDVKVQPIHKTLEELMGIPMYKGANMYVGSNKEGINGASAILYNDELKKIADKAEDDLFIIPSSIHEIILLPTQGCTVEEIDELHKECGVNLEPIEWLSNNIYYYDREKNEVRQVTKH